MKIAENSINLYQLTYLDLHSLQKSCADPEGGRGTRGPDPPLENYKNIGLLSKSGPDPLNNHKANKPAFNFGPLSARQRNAI